MTFAGIHAAVRARNTGLVVIRIGRIAAYNDVVGELALSVGLSGRGGLDDREAEHQ